MTETSLVVTVFGPAQLVDDGDTRKLRIRGIPHEFTVGRVTTESGPEGIVPFTEGEVVIGGYLFDADNVEIEEPPAGGEEGGRAGTAKRVLLLPVSASLPYFFLPPHHKNAVDQIIAHLRPTGRSFELPKSEDLTAEVIEKLREASLVWKEEAATFDLPGFISRIEAASMQKGFENILQLKLEGDVVYLLSVGRHIASVFDLSPRFMLVDASKAVRLDYGGDGNTWLAPYGRRRAKQQ